MNKHLLFIMGITVAGAAAAQTDGISPTNDALAVDSTAFVPDSVQGISFTTAQIDEVERASTAAARAREERAQARASVRTSAEEPAARGSSGSAKRTPSGAKLSLDRATDPKGTKHWKRMRARSIRKDPDSPPGTTPVY